MFDTLQFVAKLRHRSI